MFPPALPGKPSAFASEDKMKATFRVVVGSLLVAVCNVPAAILYVSQVSTNPIRPYATWYAAATNIQDAVNAAAPGDTVLVTNGTYASGGRALNRVVVDKPVTVQSVN